jgi:phosphate:Na+ symporter
MLILSLTGALVIFLYGMKTMSESLQKLAGERMRNLLSRFTSTTSRGIVAGFGVTAILQSSSAVTVMLVSFVNAGLITFTQSLGVIFGANIGTTLTAWLIYGLGFGSILNIQNLLLPMAALALPFLFLRKAKNKAFAEMIIGFVLIFTGFAFFRESVPAIDENFAFFHQIFFPDNFYLNTFSFVLVGILITLLFQSSGATIILTMVLAAQGWLTYSTALAMVLGENIGTTLTANFAAIVTNRAARRTAVAHLLFNVLGLVWIFPFIHIIARYLEEFTMFAVGSENSIPLGLAIFHSLFNIFNTMIVLALLTPFGRLCFALLPEQKKAARRFSLKFLSGNLFSTAELNILQDKRKLGDFTKTVSGMFTLVSLLLNEKDDRKFARKSKNLNRSNKMVQETQQEIEVYLQNLSFEKLTSGGQMHLKAVAKINERLAGMATISMTMAQVIRQKNEEKAWFSQELRNALTHSLQIIGEALMQKSEIFIGNSSTFSNSKINHLRAQIQNFSENPDPAASQIASNATSHFQQLVEMIINVVEILMDIDAASLEINHNTSITTNRKRSKI